MPNPTDKTFFASSMPAVTVMVVGPLATKLPQYLAAAGMEPISVTSNSAPNNQRYAASFSIADASKVAKWLKAQGANEEDTEAVMERWSPGGWKS